MSSLPFIIASEHRPVEQKPPEMIQIGRGVVQTNPDRREHKIRKGEAAGAHADVPAGGVEHTPDLFLTLKDALAGPCDVVIENTALRREDDAALCPLKKLAAQFCLQILDPAAHGGLGEEERRSGAGDVHIFSHIIEILVGVKTGRHVLTSRLPGSELFKIGNLVLCDMHLAAISNRLRIILICYFKII